MWAFLIFFLLLPCPPTTEPLLPLSLTLSPIYCVCFQRAKGFLRNAVISEQAKSHRQTQESNCTILLGEHTSSDKTLLKLRDHAKVKKKLRMWTWDLNSDCSTDGKESVDWPEAFLQTLPGPHFPLLLGKSNTCLTGLLQWLNEETWESTTNNSLHFLSVH